MPSSTFTNVTSINALLGTRLSHIITSTAAGWTLSYADSTLLQYGYSKGHFQIAMGAGLSSAGTSVQTHSPFTQLISGGTIEQQEIAMTSNYSLSPTNKKYWGHPGRTIGGGSANLASSRTSNFVSLASYVKPPYAQVWYFYDIPTTYVHIVMKMVAVGGHRYQHLSFGGLDVEGLGVSAPSYTAAIGTNVLENSTNVNSSGYLVNSVESESNGFTGTGGSNCFNMVYTFGSRQSAPSTAPDAILQGQLSCSGRQPMCKLNDIDALYGTDRTDGHLLSFMKNLEIRGGASELFIADLPVVYKLQSNTIYFGKLPGMGLCNIGDVALETEIEADGKRWMVFPIKAKGLSSKTKRGSASSKEPNSSNWGFAYQIPDSMVDPEPEEG